MKRIYWFLLGAILTVTGSAYALNVNSELIKAYFEKLSADPSGAAEARVYYNTTLKKPKIYNGTAWQDLGGGGAGEINYIGSPDSNTDWTGVGGGITSSTTINTAELPRVSIDSQALKLVNENSGSNGTSYCFQIGEVDKNKKLKIEWVQLVDGSLYGAGDFEYRLVSDTSSTCLGTETTVVLHSSGDDQPVAIPNISGTIYDEFDSTDADYYELFILRDISAQTNSGWISLSSVTVGPGKLHSGLVGHSIANPAMTWANDGGLTITTTGMKFQRLGENMVISGYAALSGTPTESGDFTLSFDDYTFAEGSSGKVTFQTQTTNLPITGLVYKTSATELSFYKENTGAAIAKLIGTQMGGGSSGLIDVIFFNNVTVKISEWSGSGVLNTITQDNLTEWTAFTPTVNGISTSATYGYFRRVGSDMEVSVQADVSGVATATITIDTPDSKTIDTSGMPNAATNFVAVGVVQALDASVGYHAGTVVYRAADTKVTFFSEGSLSVWDANEPMAAWASGDKITATYRLPITEFAGSQSSLVGFSHASESQSGLVKRNKWQRKTLGADVGATITDISSGGGSNADFHFTGLTVGKTYMIYLQADLYMGAATSNESATVQIIHNSVIVGTTKMRTTTAGGVAEENIVGIQAQFVAAATTVTFDFTEVGTTFLRGNGDYNETWAMLKELDNYGTESSEF